MIGMDFFVKKFTDIQRRWFIYWRTYQKFQSMIRHQKNKDFQYILGFCLVRWNCECEIFDNKKTMPFLQGFCKGCQQTEYEDVYRKED